MNVDVEPPRRMTIWIPPSAGNREALPTAPTASAVEVPETALQRCERVAPELIAIPKSDDELSTVNVEQEQPRENHAEGTHEAPQRVLMVTEEEGEPSEFETRHKETAVASKPDRQATRSGNPDPAPREETTCGDHVGLRDR